MHLKDANAAHAISFPDRQSFGSGVSLTYGICCLGLAIGRHLSESIVRKTRAEGGERGQSASTSGLWRKLRTIEAWTRVLVHVTEIEIAADLYLVDCVTSQKEIY